MWSSGHMMGPGFPKNVCFLGHATVTQTPGTPALTQSTIFFRLLFLLVLHLVGQ